MEDAALGALRSVAAAPLFGLFDFQLGNGIVGGPLIPVLDVAREAAGAASRLLAGEAPARVRPPDRPGRSGVRRPGARALEDRRRPPAAGSAVLFREPTLWQAHRWKILGVLAVGVLQAALILALTLALIGRGRAERDLRKSREQYALAVEGTTDGLWDWDVRTGVIDFTPRSRTLLGIAAGRRHRLAAWEERITPTIGIACRRPSRPISTGRARPSAPSTACGRGRTVPAGFSRGARPCATPEGGRSGWWAR